jgi:hypothetical protein
MLKIKGFILIQTETRSKLFYDENKINKNVFIQIKIHIKQNVYFFFFF